MTTAELEELKLRTLRPPTNHVEYHGQLQLLEWEYKMSPNLHLRELAKSIKRSRGEIERQVFIHEVLPRLLKESEAQHRQGCVFWF
jgi:hypothetical protein